MKILLKIQRHYLVMILILFPSVLPAQDVLQDYLETAALNNPGLKAKFSEYLAALEVVPQVKSLPDPQLAFGYFIQPVQTRTGPQEARLSASQMFPWFGTLKARENVAVQNARVKFEAFKEAKSDLFHQLRSNYYNIYFNQKAIEITKGNLEILNSFAKVVNIKVESGLVSAVDEYRIEIESGDFKNQMAFLVDQQLVLESTFNKLMNVGENELVMIPESLPVADFYLTKELTLDSIMTNNHMLLTLDKQAESHRLKQEEAIKAGLPVINLGLDYLIIGEGENNLTGKDAFMFPKIGISIPVYRKKYMAMVQQAVILEEGKILEKENMSNRLKILFEDAWKNYSDASRRIFLFKDQQNLARKSMDLLLTEYTAGLLNFEDLLQMERKVLKYDLEYEKAKADKLAAISFIMYLMGN